MYQHLVAKKRTLMNLYLLISFVCIIFNCYVLISTSNVPYAIYFVALFFISRVFASFAGQQAVKIMREDIAIMQTMKTTEQHLKETRG